MSEAAKALEANKKNLSRKAEIEKKIKELEEELRGIKILTPKEIIDLKTEIAKKEKEKTDRQEYRKLVLYSEKCKFFLEKNIGDVEFEESTFYDVFSGKYQGYNVNGNFLKDENIHDLAYKIEKKEIDKMSPEELIMAAQYLWVEINLPENFDDDEIKYSKVLAGKEPTEKDMYDCYDWNEDFNEPKYGAEKYNTIDVLFKGQKVESPFEFQHQVMHWPNKLNFDINCTEADFSVWVH